MWYISNLLKTKKFLNNINLIICMDTANIDEIKEANELGADIATVPYKVITQMTKHPLTEKGIENFLKDWEGASLKL